MENSYVCSFCGQSFKRNDHLRRHQNLHTRKDRYKCLCGETFIRKDVLAQHMRSCQTFQGRSNNDLGRVRTRATRAKKACNRCANAKVKCDSQEPCGRCREKSWNCEYTREGYIDPYEQYRITHDSDSTPQDRFSSTSTAHTSLDFISDNVPQVDLLAPMNDTRPISAQQNSLVWPAERDILHTNPSSSQEHTGPGGNQAFELDHLNLPQISHDFGLGIFENEAGDVDAASWFLEPLGVVVHPLIAEDFLNPIEDRLNTAEISHSTVFSRKGFYLEQTDPVEAKCAAIRSLFRTPDSAFSEDLITNHLTRSKLLLCHQLYGAHFQYHFPILHCPTHRFTESSPILLSAMILAGAHYSADIMEPADISKFAVRLLMVVQTQPQEMALEAPDLSTLQACVIICALLACSRDRIANQSWPIHFGRILSMSERLGILNAEEPLDYQNLTVEEFDWSAWIELESRRRVACQVFCQDMAGCVFFDRPAALSPLSVDVTLPCYENAWEAESASECLHRLRNSPTQMSISAALRALRRGGAQNVPVLEASGYGMFVLINGLHSFVHHITREEINPSFSGHTSSSQALSDPLYATGIHMAMEKLRNDFSRGTIEAVADEMIKMHGAPAFQELTVALNVWRSSWDRRKFGDNESDGRNFSADPLPFWYLAKLFLVLYLIEDGRSESDEWRLRRARAGDTKGKLLFQERIVSWLRKLGADRNDAGDQTANNAPVQSAPEQDGSRVLLLMRPLQDL